MNLLVAVGCRKGELSCPSAADRLGTACVPGREDRISPKGGSREGKLANLFINMQINLRRHLLALEQKYYNDILELINTVCSVSFM
jgi:hypothetical protein